MTTNCDVKYPHISVQLTGYDGNAFSIMGRVTQAMKKGGCTKQQCDDYMTEAMSGDYNYLLVVSMQTVNVT